MSREQNLLFGVLAVALGRLAPGALQQWRGGAAETDLGRRLVDDGSLSEDERAAIDSLAGLAVKAHGGNATAALRTLGGTDPALRAVVETLLNPEPGATRPGTEPDFGEAAGAGESIFGAGEAPTPIVPVKTGPGEDEVVPAVQEHPGRYIELREFAKGGMGRILLVQDVHFGRDVALKQLLTENLGVATRPGAPSTQLLTVPIIARFLQEARITGQLEHPSIVPVYELGYRDDGSLYYTMKFVRGKTLQAAIAEAKDLRERLLLLPHFLDLCHALSYAHDRGVIHRDLKPLNLMIGEFGETVVIDWGIAKVKGAGDIHEREMRESVRALRLGDAESTAKTSYGQTIGSPYFMPPEQAAGRTEEIDERSDIYALGAVLYAILTGHAPYEQMKVREFMEKVTTFDAKPVREVDPAVPPELAAICARAMARDRERRYPTARELTDDVQRFLAGGMVSAYDYRLGELLRRFVRKHWKPLATAAVFIVAALTFGVYYNIRVTHEKNLARQAERVARDAEQEAQNQRDAAEAARETAETERSRAQRELYFANVALVQRSVEEQRMAQARAQIDACPEAFRDWEWRHLTALCQADRLTIRAGGRHVAWITAGNTILCGTDNGTISQVNPATGAVGSRLVEKAGFGAVLRVSANGERVAVKGDAAVWLYDRAGSGDLLFRFDEPEVLDQQHYLAISASGRRLAALNSDGKARVWAVDDAGAVQELLALDVDTAKGFGLWMSPDGAKLLVQRSAFGENGWVRAFQVITLPGGDVLHEGELRDPLTIHAAAFSPDGGHVALGTDEETQVYTVSPWARVATLPGRVSHPDTVAFDPRGTRLAVGTSDGDVVVHDLASGTTRTARAAHQDVVRAVAWAPEQDQVATASFDRTAKLWRASDLRPLTTFRGHDKSLFALTFSPEGDQLMTGSFDGTAKVWDLTAEADFAPVETLACHPGRGLLAGSLDGAPMLWEVGTGRRVRALEREPGTRYSGFAFDAGGMAVAALAAGQDRRVVVWDTESGDGRVAVPVPAGDVRVGFAGRRLVVLTGGQLTVHDTVSGLADSLVEDVTAWTGRADGALLAAVGPGAAEGERTVRIVDTATGAVEHTFTVETVHDAVPAFAPDGNALYVGTWERGEAGDRGRVYVWNVSAGEAAAPLTGHGRQVACFAFTADGAHLATGSTDSTVIVWDRATGRPLHTLAGHASNINALAFSPDGARLVTASQDGTFKLWDTADGREVLTLQNAALDAAGQVVAPAEAAFTADGRELVLLTTPEPLAPRILRTVAAEADGGDAT